MNRSVLTLPAATSATHNTHVTRRAWSIAEIAKMTGLSPNFIRGEIRRGLLIGRSFGRRVLVLEADLAAYLHGGVDEN